MPAGFPSHQGLILPLWRRFPREIDGVALCVGAIVPDLVDAPLRPGGPGQWAGHSLVGLFTLCLVAGLALSRLARRALPARWIARLDEGAPPAPGAGREALSVLIGAASHIAFDFVTHGNFWLLWPWLDNPRVFPEWWYYTWMTFRCPPYREPIRVAPHFISWLLFSIAGVVLFFRCLRPRAARG